MDNASDNCFDWKFTLPYKVVMYSDDNEDNLKIEIILQEDVEFVRFSGGSTCEVQNYYQTGWIGTVDVTCEVDPTFTVLTITSPYDPAKVQQMIENPGSLILDSYVFKYRGNY
jgi:hypothetical protein